MRKRGGPFIWVTLAILVIAAAGWVGTERTLASERSSSHGESVVCGDEAGPDAVPTIGDTVAGACRMMPECWADADCAAFCPAAGGKCIHSKCPIRICKCS
jgi:hypothetical protein